MIILQEKTKMGKRVRITNSSLNSYGTRVLTEGMDIEQYQRNPVLLYMHERGSVIGYMRDVKKEGDEVTGEPVFDEATELSKRCKAQWEFGSLKMVSAAIDIMAMSDEPGVLTQGQTSPTITKSKLYETSIVDIGANDDAIVLVREGKTIKMGRDGDNCLPLLENKQQKTNKKMELKEIALQLGLPVTATEDEIKSKILELKGSEEALKKEREAKAALELKALTQAVEGAINDKRIDASRKEQFVELGKKIGLDSLQKTIEAMHVEQKLSAMMSHEGEVVKTGSAQWAKLSEVPEDKLMELREKNASEYKRLYKAEYGIECEI